MHFCFALSLRTSWKPFVCFSLWFEHMFDFHCFNFMIFYLCSFSCYNMVAKFLLSRLYLSCPCFKFFDPSAQHLHIWSRLCRCMSPKKLFLLLSLTYSRTSRSWAWGCWYISNVSIIFDAPCLFLHHLLSVFYTLWHFYAFSELTY
jgi:hypothetical protein